jgi:diacylglycerol kinase family enzyme
MGMMFAPDAEIDDGMLDIVTIRATSKLILLRDLRMIYGGRHRNHPAVSMTCGQYVTAEPIDGEQPILLETDGECLGRLPASFEVLPGALTLVG